MGHGSGMLSGQPKENLWALHIQCKYVATVSKHYLRSMKLFSTGPSAMIMELSISSVMHVEEV